MAADFLSPLPSLRVPYQESIQMIPASCQIRLPKRAPGEQTGGAIGVCWIPMESDGVLTSPIDERKPSVADRPGKEVALDLEPQPEQPERLDDEHGYHEDGEQHGRLQGWASHRSSARVRPACSMA